MLKATFNFDEFRFWFNQNFSLSFDGKYRSLSFLRNEFGMRFIEHLFYKLRKIYLRFKSVYWSVLTSSIVSIKLSGHTLKLYSR